MFAGVCVEMLVTPQALGTVTNAGWLWRLAGEALQFGAMVCVLYFALEPYVRRRWPTSLITWSRLLAGDWRDPLVGRDVLLGVAFTVLFWVVAVLAGTAAVWTGNTPLLAVEPVTAPDAVSVIAMLLIDAMFTLGLFLIFVIVRTLLRRTWLAALVVWSMMLILSLDSSPTEMAVTGLMYGASLWIAARWGLLVLALSSPHIVPALTLIPGDWYFGGSMVYLVVLAAAAWYGFRTATAGRPVVSQQWLEG
jgi:serine/threonine-protein kinase